MIGFLALLFSVTALAIVWSVWKYRRDLILGWMAYMAFKFYTRTHRRN